MSDGLITGTVNLALFGLFVVIRRLVHREGLAAFGLSADTRSFRLFVAGFTVGALLFSIYPLLAVALGAGSVSVVRTELSSTLMLLGSWAFGFAGVALFEEGLFRGYLLPKLRARFSITVAITAQAALFAAFHLISYEPGRYLWLGMLNLLTLAVILAALVLRTGSLMAAVGFHVAWDLVQEMLLMRQLRGADTLVNLSVSDGFWTGTAGTPETGAIVSVVLGLFGALVAIWRTAGPPARDGSVR